MEGTRDGHAVHEGVQEESDQGRIPDVATHHVRLLTEVEMSHEGVLGEMHEQEPQEDQEGGFDPATRERLGEEPRERDRDEESRREGEEELEGPRGPAWARRDGRGPDDIPGRRDHRVQETRHVSLRRRSACTSPRSASS
jgi:hypothetical protein